MPAKKIIDDEEVVVKKPTKKVVADDEEVVVKKTSKKVTVADDDDVVVKKATKKAVADDDAAPTKAKASHADPAAPATTSTAAPTRSLKLSAAPTSSTSDEWVAPNYDEMTFEQFAALLSQIPMSIAMAQKSTFDSTQATLEAESAKNQAEAFLDGEEGGFQYNDMLSRAAVIMRECGIGDNTRSIEIPPPIMEKSGSKRIVIANFNAICDAIGRSIQEVQKFFERQTSATTSLDGNGALILKMRLDAKGVERIFDQFLDEWITCKVCKSIDTTLEKEKSMNRLYIIKCNKCKAFRHKEMTESAYAANTTKRSKLRSAGML